VFAHLLATDRPHKLAEAFTLQRFASGALIDEAAAAGHLPLKESTDAAYPLPLVWPS